MFDNRRARNGVKYYRRYRVFRLTGLLFIIGLGLVSIIGTGGGSSGDGTPTYYRDADDDGYGDAGDALKSDTQPPGYVDNKADCNDNDADLHPGQPETADDGIDQDCDGFDLKTWFLDSDRDGFGDPDITVTANSRPDGYVANGNDCDDQDKASYPGGCPPPTVFLTVNDIPADMNGSVPYLSNNDQWTNFTLAVPTRGFTWNITVDCPCGCAEDSLQVWTEPPPPYGNDLSDFFQSDGQGGFFWRVDETRAFDETGALTLKATITDKCGQPSDTAALTVRTVAMTPLLDPFDLPDPWLFVYQRDDYTIATAALDHATTVSSAPQPNGVPDFIEDLWLLGLGTSTPDPAFAAVSCNGGNGGNNCLARLILEKSRELAYRLFHCQPDGTRGSDGVNIRLWIENEPGAPTPGDFADQALTGEETEKAFSLMGFGGGNLNNAQVSLSQRVDLRNQRNENNAQKDYGVLSTSLARYLYLYFNNDPGLSLMAAAYVGDIVPLLGGKAIGALEEDARVIDLSIPKESLSSRERSRRSQMLLLIDLVSEALGTLAAHEIAHSVGLVPAGPPPHGFFGGETKAAFIENPKGSTAMHIDTPGLNIMQAGPGSGFMPDIPRDKIAALTGPEPIFFFNEINLAYLQGRLVLLPE